MGGSSSNEPEAKIPDLSTSGSSVKSRISDMLDANAHGDEPKCERTNPLGYVCVECGAPVKSIYREYSRGNIRLTRCAACGRIADKYCELEAQLIITDMLLHKPMVYRHLLYNRYGKEADKWMWKLMLLILLCDAYLRCNVVFGQEVQSDIHPAVLALLFFLALGVSTVAFATYSFALILLNVGRCSNRMIVSGLALSSFPKLLITLQWVWIYKGVYFTWVIFALTITSNVEAIRVVRQCTYPRALAQVACGLCCSLSVMYMLFQATGHRIWFVVV